ncbi:MAG: GWxTD domain-containing protein [candidate division WOR-3 bacterium]|uniref:GWxTD domain-containing protein n=1 Tax=candidate division WOR-3 bacterium TaxID=2052148 RepID=A0A7C1NCJ6_UNCW3|nr:GWxTD domain-containing protein [candidate division WOR-3 bacterium]
MIALFLPWILISGVVLPIFQGNIKINADYAVYEDTGGLRVMDFFYEIPYSGLTFVRNESGFTARYRITMEALDRSSRVMAADVWEHEVQAADYSVTVDPDSIISGAVRFSLPRGTSSVRVSVYDRLSERQSMSRFIPEGDGRGVHLRLFKSGRPNPSRIYGLDDTIEIWAEFVSASNSVGSWEDSVLWLVKKGKMVLTGVRAGVTRNADRMTAELRLPVIDSGFWGSGIYTAEVRLLSGNGAGETDFEVKLPFYYDDSLWNARVEQLIYIASRDEIRRLKRTVRVNRQSAWKEFWQDKDPNPSTTINEREQEYFSRIEYCEQNFSRGDLGYRSDRGRIYVLYGPPDQVESRPFEIDRPAEEVWYYYQRNLTFTFVDRFGSGEFVLWRQ